MSTSITPLGIAPPPVPPPAPTPGPLANMLPTACQPLAHDRITTGTSAAAPSLAGAFAATALAGEEGAVLGGPPGWMVGATIGAGALTAAKLHDARQWQAGADEFHALQDRSRHGTLAPTDRQRYATLGATYGRSPAPMAGHAPSGPAISTTPIHAAGPSQTVHPLPPVRSLHDAIATSPALELRPATHTGHGSPDLRDVAQPVGVPIHAPTAADLALFARTTFVGGALSPDRSRELNAALPAGAKGHWVYRPGETASERAAKYQEQITGQPWGNVYDVGNGRTVDGVRFESGHEIWIEAKGPGKAIGIDKSGGVHGWYQGFQADVNSINEGGRRAHRLGTTLRVDVAEKPYANALRVALKDQGTPNTLVVRNPAEQ